jgi:anti-sigma factor RsiW
MIDNFDGERSNIALDERFELLSAYLDGEATVSERQQVDAWLASDPAFAKQYHQLQQMHQAFPAISVPSSQSAENLAAGVFEKLDRRRNRKLAWIGGGAIAATLVATIAGLGGLLGGGNNNQLQLAHTPAPLMVALNDPILSIPAKGGQAMEVPMNSPEVHVD